MTEEQLQADMKLLKKNTDKMLAMLCLACHGDPVRMVNTATALLAMTVSATTKEGSYNTVLSRSVLHLEETYERENV